MILPLSCGIYIDYNVFFLQRYFVLENGSLTYAKSANDVSAIKDR